MGFGSSFPTRLRPVANNDHQAFFLMRTWAVFLFFYFLFPFFTKIYFRFKNLQKYTRPPGSRAARANLQKKIQQKIADRSLGSGRPAAGRPALFFVI